MREERLIYAAFYVVLFNMAPLDRSPMYATPESGGAAMTTTARDEARYAAKRARREFAGVLPGQTRKWRQFYGLAFDWVLREAVASGRVEVFDTGSVGRGVRAC